MPLRLLSYYLLSTLSLWESLHVVRGTLGYFVRNGLLPAGIMNCMDKNQLWESSRSWFCLGAALRKGLWVTATPSHKIWAVLLAGMVKE
ncbi:hypothetical protein [Paenibacillus lautus]|uniref:hypothetical protein n=1 Tax=Paenibacillus lautus TaxID=1401 RepID=UPI001BCBDF3F|nr:hypothetical protein [Paenibacillus lautus]